MGSFHANVELPPTVFAPRAARRLVAETLLAWRWGTDDARFNVVLLANEVMTNAVEHSRTDNSLLLELAGSDHRLLASVADRSALLPMVRELDRSAQRGRGMQLVAALASRWGVEDHHRGKRVWFEVPAHRR